MLLVAFTLIAIAMGCLVRMLNKQDLRKSLAKEEERQKKLNASY
jgi:heme exporter protein D